MLFPSRFVDPRSVRFGSKTVTQVSETHGGTVYANMLGDPHQWQIELTTCTMEYSDCMELFAFACSLSGKLKMCRLRNPMPVIGLGLSDTCTIREDIPAGVSSIPISSFQSNRMGVLLPGDFIQITGSDKAYMVTGTVNTNGVGESTIPITPKLRRAATKGQKLVSGKNVFFSMSLTTDEQTIIFSAKDGVKQKVILGFEERLYD
ncbi:hypothetical protein [Pseudoalteromonas sp. S16_S37]|uniref:hypothetical protein n=1 Tax=Pseudoalteromonas sp. S16_S37 TaxID=2720228 RepID=UPI0016818C38|nr:hypothetical protein [Pseudoalteromonas sp. S16_S37]MBD1583503.1 hypothetical protein [Pseudoalteromonas sp. S16_S37]